jgi:Domain of unknown function (DUF4388)
MMSMSPETQLRAYAGIRTLETRSHALEALIGSLKRLCLHGGPGGSAELISSAAEVRWQIRQLNDYARELEASLGFVSNGNPSPEKRREVREPAGMRGTTDVLPVPDLVGVLSSARKTGTLTLQAGDTMYVFEFQDGVIVHAVTNQANPELRLGTILIAQSKLTEEELQENLDACLKASEMLGEHLVRSQTVSVPDLRAALEVQVRRIFEAAFGLEGAQFNFLEGSVSNIAQRTSLNTTHLLLEAARQGDERRRDGQPDGRPTPMVAARSALDSILPG